MKYIIQPESEGSLNESDSVAEIAIYYGQFINTIITFIIVAFAIFMVVKLYNKMKEKMDQANIDEKMLIENEALILSMTKKEKENPKIISGSRRKRIAKGSGVDVSKINKLLKQFKMMSDMMKKMSQGKKIPSGMIPDEMLNQLK